MSTYGEHLRSNYTAASPGEGTKDPRRFTGPPDQCRKGGSHRWNNNAEQPEARLKTSKPEQDLRVRLGSCVRCGDTLLAISSHADPRWAVHEQLTSFRPAEDRLGDTS
ncbi:hypothetical protein GCM10027569_01440 [Flindersiella endophytica]